MKLKQNSFNTVFVSALFHFHFNYADSLDFTEPWLKTTRQTHLLFGTTCSRRSLNDCVMERILLSCAKVTKRIPPGGWGDRWRTACVLWLAAVKIGGGDGDAEQTWVMIWATNRTQQERRRWVEISPKAPKICVVNVTYSCTSNSHAVCSDN